MAVERSDCDERRRYGCRVDATQLQFGSGVAGEEREPRTRHRRTNCAVITCKVKGTETSLIMIHMQTSMVRLRTKATDSLHTSLEGTRHVREGQKDWGKGRRAVVIIRRRGTEAGDASSIEHA